MHCEKAEMLLPLLVFDEIDDGEKVELMAHLSECSACSEKLGDLRVTMNLLRDGFAATPAPVLSAERRTKLMKKLSKPPKRGRGKKNKATTFAGLPLSWFTPSQWKFRPRFLHVAAGLAIAVGLVGLFMPAMGTARRTSPAMQGESLAKSYSPSKDGDSEFDGRNDYAAKSNEWSESSLSYSARGRGPEVLYDDVQPLYALKLSDKSPTFGDNSEPTPLALHDARRSSGIDDWAGRAAKAPDSNWEFNSASGGGGVTGERPSRQQLAAAGEKSFGYKNQNTPTDFDSDGTVREGVASVQLGDRAAQAGSGRFNAPLPPPIVGNSSGPESFGTTSWHAEKDKKEVIESRFALKDMPTKDGDGWRRGGYNADPSDSLVRDAQPLVRPAPAKPGRHAVPSTPVPTTAAPREPVPEPVIDSLAGASRPATPAAIAPTASGPGAAPAPPAESKPTTGSTTFSIEPTRPGAPATKAGDILTLQGTAPSGGTENYLQNPTPAPSDPANPGLAFESRAKDALAPIVDKKLAGKNDPARDDADLYRFDAPQQPNGKPRLIPKPTGDPVTKSNAAPDDSLEDKTEGKKTLDLALEAESLGLRSTDLGVEFDREKAQQDQSGRQDAGLGVHLPKLSGVESRREKELREMLKDEAGYIKPGENKGADELLSDESGVTQFGRNGKHDDAKKLEGLIADPQRGKGDGREETTKGIKELANNEAKSERGEQLRAGEKPAIVEYKADGEMANVTRELDRTRSELARKQAEIANLASANEQYAKIQADLQKQLSVIREESTIRSKQIIELEGANNDQSSATATLRRQARLAQENLVKTQEELAETNRVLGLLPPDVLAQHNKPMAADFGVVRLSDSEDAVTRKTSGEIEKHQSVQKLLQRAAELRKTQEYDRSLQLINQALFVDPQNPAAESMKSMIEDTQIAVKSKEFMRIRNLRSAQHQMEMIESTIPYNELITYPNDWPQLTALRLGGAEGAGSGVSLDEKVRARLEEPVALNFEGNKLVNVVDTLREKTGVNFFVNWSALEAAGIEQDTPITLQPGHIPASEALKLVIGQASAGNRGEKLGFSVIDGIVTVSTERDLSSVTEVRIYDAKKFIDETEEDEYSALRIARRITKAGDLVIAMKDELSKSQNLDAVTVREINNHLIVQATQEQHKTITELLSRLQGGSHLAGKAIKPPEDLKNDDRSELQPAANFRIVPVNPWTLTQADAQSTFALDVDTASYTLGRRYIQRGFLPPVGSVRMEEYINAFDYNYVNNSSDVFRIHIDGAPAPFAPTGEANTKLIKVGVKGKVIGRDGRKPANLVLVVDTSGSMARPDRLPLIQHSLELLIDQLSEHDTVSLVTFGSDVLTHLAATPASNKDAIRTAIRSLQANGPTNLLKGVEAGYKLAVQAHKSGSINRVIVCSDGIATLGETEADTILTYVENYRKQGISCTAVGFGAGAYDDDMMEKLANKGDGTYHFVDSKREARKVFVDDLTATLQTIAKDAKIQVEFNKDRVRRYRLIGYENRAVADKDFRNDTIDAGEVGSGQSSTALYEVELIGDEQADIGTVYVRYRNTDTEKIEEISQRLTSALIRERSPKEDPRFFLAAAAAEFAELLRDSEHATGGNLAKLQSILEQTVPHLPLDEKAAELLDLVRRAQGLPRAP